MTNEELKRLLKNEDYSSHWEEKRTTFKARDVDEIALLDFFKSAKA